MKRFALLILLGASMLVISGCSLLSDGPGKVVEKFYRYVEKGELEAAKNLCSKQLRDTLGAKLIAGLSKQTEGIKAQGGIKIIAIVNEEISGETARVATRVTYENGSSVAQNNNNLIKEDGAWRLTISK